MPGDTETRQPQIDRKNRWEAMDLAHPKLDRAARDITEQDPHPEPSYYDISILKPPVWTPEVAAYFFLGGLSAGAYILSRLSARLGGETMARASRVAAYVAFGTVLPCAPLLIVDLGDPKRFHHMLRVIKPGSPMSVGTWTLMAYTMLSGVMALREWVFARREEPVTGIARWIDGAACGAGDAFGIPAALLLAGYTGVLLSTTSTPIWCKNPWLGPMFSAGAMNAGTAAVRLALELTKSGRDAETEERADRVLREIGTAGHLAEGATLAGFVASAGPLAKPLVTGEQAHEFIGGVIAVGLALPELLERLPVPKKARRLLKLAGLVSILIGGLALRHSVLEAGATSAKDPDAARTASKKKSDSE